MKLFVYVWDFCFCFSRENVSASSSWKHKHTSAQKARGSRALPISDWPESRDNGSVPAITQPERKWHPFHRIILWPGINPDLSRKTTSCWGANWGKRILKQQTANIGRVQQAIAVNDPGRKRLCLSRPGVADLFVVRVYVNNCFPEDCDLCLIIGQSGWYGHVVMEIWLLTNDFMFAVFLYRQYSSCHSPYF